MLLLQHSASGHAASAAPSGLERLQGGKSSSECNKLRLQYNHDCSVLWAHLKPHLPSSCFLLSDTYFVKLSFLMCPSLSRCLNYLFLTKCWLYMPFQSITFSLDSQGTASWWDATYNGGIRHQEVQIVFKSSKTPSKILWHQLSETKIKCFSYFQQQHSHWF